eukprot:gene16247-17865_t
MATSLVALLAFCQLAAISADTAVVALANAEPTMQVWSFATGCVSIECADLDLAASAAESCRTIVAESNGTVECRLICTDKDTDQTPCEGVVVPAVLPALETSAPTAAPSAAPTETATLSYELSSTSTTTTSPSTSTTTTSPEPSRQRRQLLQTSSASPISDLNLMIFAAVGETILFNDNPEGNVLTLTKTDGTIVVASTSAGNNGTSVVVDIGPDLLFTLTELLEAILVATGENTSSIYEYHDSPMFALLVFGVLFFFLYIFLTALTVNGCCGGRCSGRSSAEGSSDAGSATSVV